VIAAAIAAVTVAVVTDAVADGAAIADLRRVKDVLHVETATAIGLTVVTAVIVAPVVTSRAAAKAAKAVTMSMPS
jgi:hypothetical protein